MTMKELGLRMGCDPSFVTTVADALEKHGLARREPSQRDRRSKNLVLTHEGAALRLRLWAELWPGRRGAPRWIPASAGACSG